MPKRVLLIDAEPSIREALSKVLREENYQVLLAESGPEAVQKHGAGPLDLLLLDLDLPENSGWTTLQWLARLNPLLPVIIITGRSEQQQLAQQAGADALMEKPLDVPRLLEMIRQLTQESPACRTQRLRHRAASFRFMPCDEDAFRALLHQRFTLPYPAAGPAAAPHLNLAPAPGLVGAKKPL